MNEFPKQSPAQNPQQAQQPNQIARAPMSLASRVMLFVAIAVFLCSVVLGSLLQQSIKQHFAEQDAEELQVVADSVRKILQKNTLSDSQLPEALALAVVGHHGVYFQVQAAGKTLYTSPGSDLAWLLAEVSPQAKVDPYAMTSWQAGQKTFRGTVLNGPEQQQIAVAAEIDFHLHFLHQFNDALWLTVAGSVVFTLFAAWLGVRQGLAPLRQFSDDIAQVRADRLQLQLDPKSTPAELQDLVTSFNQMMTRLEQSFAQLANFSADIAHELRTPLTNMITQTQVSLNKERNSQEYRDLLYSNLEEQERLATMVSDMLWLAKTDHGLIHPQFKPLDLRQECQIVFEFFEGLAEEKQLTLVLKGEAPLLLGDKDMLRRAFSNLLSNAIRHAKTQTAIQVVLTYDVQGWHLQIENTGDAISPDHLSRLFDRFYRIDPSRQRQGEGAGLGLAIVKSIVELHGGTISAHCNIGKPSASLPKTVTSDKNQHEASPASPALVRFDIHIAPTRL